MSEVKANYSFDIRPERNGYSYTVKPIYYSWNLGIKLSVLIGFFLSFPIIGIADMRGSTGFGVFLWLIITALVVYGVLWLVNNLVRQPSTFSITDNKIQVRGKSYDRKDISALYIKHPKDGAQKYGQGGGTFIVAGTNVSGVLAANMMASGMQLNREFSASLYKSINKYRYMLYFIYGEKKVKLAGGMSENASKLLFDKILENHSVKTSGQPKAVQTA